MTFVEVSEYLSKWHTVIVDYRFDTHSVAIMVKIKIDSPDSDQWEYVWMMPVHVFKAMTLSSFIDILDDKERRVAEAHFHEVPFWNHDELLRYEGDRKCGEESR